MNSGFEKPITIKEAIANIDKRDYLLPALQRQFVWNSEQIEILFDSIMRDYPINSFMLWKVTEPSIKNNLKFYEFLKNYRQKFNELNPEFSTIGYSDFYAVIDGQQRLTSIYIGLKGSYAYKEYKKWFKDDEESVPTRMLYLDLNSEMPEENNKKSKYDFRFLTLNDLEWYKTNELERNWYKVSEILTIENRHDLDQYIEEKGWMRNRFTKDTVWQLWTVVNERPLINFYLEHNQDLSTVLDIFIRTNSGGEPLSFSDLLMSIITASWKDLDARKEIPDVINKVFAIKKGEFQINKDFVLKTCLVLLNDNIKFQVKNFDQVSIINFENHWLEIKKAIIVGFELLANLGLSNFTLRAKNAAIPIIYFIYHKQISNEINHPLKHQEDKRKIQKWINISLLKGVFGGQSDNVLTSIRRVLQARFSDHIVPINFVEEQIKTSGSTSELEQKISTLKKELAGLPFPLERIIDVFSSDPSKNLSFDDAFIDELLKTQYESADAYLILALLYPHLDYFNQDTHKDHLHYADYFKKLDKKSSDLAEEDFNFYTDINNWNSILNLQMLNSSLNSSKNDSPLKDWVLKNHIDLNSHLIPNVKLGIEDFKPFIEERKKLLIEKIKALV